MVGSADTPCGVSADPTIIKLNVTELRCYIQLDVFIWTSGNSLLTKAIHRRERRLSRTLYE